MKNNFEKGAGIALILGSLLMVITMVLHPAGGNFEHLLKISTTIIVTHSLAIISVPVSLFGFWGVTQRLNKDLVFSTAAFITISFGLVAVMCAAATNGLALPLFVNQNQGATPEIMDSIRLVLQYNTALNHAFDFIFIGAVCAAILLWSIAIFRTKKFPVWIGYFGILLDAGAVIMLLSGFVFVDLHGFRLFIFGLVSWTIVIGYLLLKSNSGAQTSGPRR